MRRTAPHPCCNDMYKSIYAKDSWHFASATDVILHVQIKQIQANLTSFVVLYFEIEENEQSIWVY